MRRGGRFFARSGVALLCLPLLLSAYAVIGGVMDRKGELYALNAFAVIAGMIGLLVFGALVAVLLRPLRRQNFALVNRIAWSAIAGFLLLLGAAIAWLALF